jgi:hypothetical protein
LIVAGIVVYSGYFAYPPANSPLRGSDPRPLPSLSAASIPKARPHVMPQGAMPRASAPAIGSLGDRGRIIAHETGRLVPGALSAGAYSQWQDAQTANDRYGKARLLLSGAVAPLRSGTPAIYVTHVTPDRHNEGDKDGKGGGGSYQVWVADGPHAGERFWIAAEFWKRR